MEKPSPANTVWRCYLCQYLVSENFECPDHPESPQDEVTALKYISLKRLGDKYFAVFFDELLKSAVAAGAWTYGEASAIAEWDWKSGHCPHLRMPATPYNKMPAWVPEEFTAPLNSEIISWADTAVRIDWDVTQRGRWDVPEPVVHSTPIFDQFRHMWNHCPSTLSWLVAEHVDPREVDVQTWATRLFVGERTHVPNHVKETIAEIVARPALALYLVISGEAWRKLEHKRKPHHEPKDLEKALARKVPGRSFEQLGLAHGIPGETLKSAWKRRKRS